MIYQATGNKKAGVIILLSDKIYFKQKKMLLEIKSGVL